MNRRFKSFPAGMPPGEPNTLDYVSPVYPVSMFLDCGRKLENLEKPVNATQEALTSLFSWQGC